MTATALTFHKQTFHPVSKNGQPWLTAAEIATALGYARNTFINRLYDRNKDEFTATMTGIVKLTTPGGTQETRAFSLRGAHLIAMFARTSTAKEFRRWVLDTLDKEVGAGETATTKKKELPKTSKLNATVLGVSMARNGDCVLYINCGVGFNIRVPIETYRKERFAVGDRIVMECLRGVNPLCGPFAAVYRKPEGEAFYD